MLRTKTLTRTKGYSKRGKEINSSPSHGPVLKSVGNMCPRIIKTMLERKGGKKKSTAQKQKPAQGDFRLYSMGNITPLLFWSESVHMQVEVICV